MRRSAEADPPLLPDERVVWRGRPDARIRFRPIDALLVPFSFLWGGFAIFWNVSVWMAGAPVTFSFFGLPFLFIGLYIIAGRFWLDRKVLEGTRYFVTDKRVLIQRNFPASLKSLQLERLPTLDLRQRQDGSGTIRFGNSANWFLWGSGIGIGIWQRSLDPALQFVEIPKVLQVYELIQREAAGV